MTKIISILGMLALFACFWLTFFLAVSFLIRWKSARREKNDPSYSRFEHISAVPNQMPALTEHRSSVHPTTPTSNSVT